MKKVKVQIKHYLTGSILFEYSCEDNTILKTLLEAIKKGANLRSANLRSADLSGANLRSADLRSANLSGAYLSGAYLSGADLSGADLSGADLSGADLSGADLSGADLSGANLSGADLSGANLRSANLSGAYLSGANLRSAKNIPQEWIDICCKDMLYIYEHSRGELKFLKEAILNGKINGEVYTGECCCLIGSLAKAKTNALDTDVSSFCQSTIPYYIKGTENPAEQWFLGIHKGDTPDNNFFAWVAFRLLDDVMCNRFPTRYTKEAFEKHVEEVKEAAESNTQECNCQCKKEGHNFCPNCGYKLN